MVDVPVRPNSYERVQKLRCVSTGRTIANNLSFNRLDLERMIIYQNSLWAIEDRARVVAFDVITGERLHEITFEYGIGTGCTIFGDKIFAYTDHELFEIVSKEDGTKYLKRVASCPHDIRELYIQRLDDSDITFVVETKHGIIITATGSVGMARCKVLKGVGHFLCGVYSSHVYIYCLESNDIIDTKNEIIERRFPPDDDEMWCRFRMSPDGDLFYCCWVDSEGPWTIEVLNAVTGNRRRFVPHSNHVYFIPCARFIPFYEPFE